MEPADLLSQDGDRALRQHTRQQPHRQQEAGPTHTHTRGPVHPARPRCDTRRGPVSCQPRRRPPGRAPGRPTARRASGTPPRARARSRTVRRSAGPPTLRRTSRAQDRRTARSAARPPAASRGVERRRTTAPTPRRARSVRRPPPPRPRRRPTPPLSAVQEVPAGAAPTPGFRNGRVESKNSRSRWRVVMAGSLQLQRRLVHVQPQRQVKCPFQAHPADPGDLRTVRPSAAGEPRPVDQVEHRVAGLGEVLPRVVLQRSSRTPGPGWTGRATSRGPPPTAAARRAVAARSRLFSRPSKVLSDHGAL